MECFFYISTQRSVFYCKKCAFKYNMKSCLTIISIVVHDGIVLEWVGLKCKLCGSIQRKAPCLQIHMQSIHKGVSFECQKCNVKFTG